MIGSHLKLALIDNIERRTEPVLSLYVDVGPAAGGTAGKAFALRAAEAMRGLDLPKAYVADVVGRLKSDFARLEGRTLVLFAGEDPNADLEAYHLQSELPFLAATDGVIAHWGRPLVAPLLLALDQRERYAVIYVAADRVRVFEAFLGQIDEVADYSRSVNTEAWSDFRSSRRNPGAAANAAARGGADVDRFRRRLEEASARLYRTLAPQVEELMAAGRADRVILIGQPQTLGAFESAMSGGMAAKVVGRLAPPANPAAPAREWLPLVADLIAQTEAAREEELLDRVREAGVWGFEQTLGLLQERKLRTLVVPFGQTRSVYVTESGWVAATPGEAEALRPGETVAEASLLEVLPDLVRSTGTALEFVEGTAEERLVNEFGGLAGMIGK